MKTMIAPNRLPLTGIGVACLLSLASAFAAETANPEPQQSGQPAGAAPAPVIAAPSKLPYGVDDILKLSRAQVGEEIILNYIQTSGTIYNLGANEIVYLRGEGVSERVVNGMLDQRKKVIEAAAPPAPAPTAAPAPAPVYQEPAAASAYQPAPAYAQPPPEPAPSTAYVIPYPQATAAYYGYYRSYPYYTYPAYSTVYLGYPGYCFAPSLSFGFRFGGGHHFGHSRRW